MKKIIMIVEVFLLSTVLFANNNSNSGTPSVQFYNTKIFRGYQEESNFGANVENIGDFNADGYEDFAVSAEGEDDGIGKVYLYFGKKNHDFKADVVLSAPYGYERFGYKVTSAGDFNADGFSDIVIVAKNYTTDNPVVMVYFGGPNYSTMPNIFLQKYWNVAGFGDDVAGLGDVNGDGIDDIGVVTATSMGIYFGSLNPPYYVEMGQSLNQAGFNIEYCGDLNGDGYNDIIGSNSNTNQVFVYKGGPDLDANVNQFFVSSETDTYFGHQLSAGGDINGDGFSDVVIGEMGFNRHRGRVLVYFGGADFFNSSSKTGPPADLVIDGPSGNSNFGSAVAIVKDMNGDGFDEIAVGGSNLSYMNLYYGATHPKKAVSQIFHSNDAEYGYFFTISSLDFNGDGYNEVVAGNYEADEVYLFNNEVNYIGANYDFSINDPSHINGVFSGGDINGDGIDDFFTIRVDYISGVGSRLVNVKIYSGGEKLTDEPTYSWDCDLDYKVKKDFVGDVNGDGIDEIVVGNVLIYGKKDLTSSDTLETYVLDGLMLTHGDYNNDGYSDIVTCNDENRANVVYGGSTGFTVVPIRFDVNNRSAITIDYNGDGIDDLLLSNNNRTWNDHVEIHFGKYAGFRTSSLGIERDAFIFPNEIFENFDDLLGLTKIGDINNDGYDAFTIYYRTTDDIYIGKLGSITKEWVNISFSSLEGIGDINHDGIDDVMGYKAIYYGYKGISTFDYTDADVRMEQSLSPLGDINGDGELDFVNSEYYDFYLYFGSSINIAPRIISVKDVPADQGGKVTLTWFKSGYDGSKVTSYRIERSIAPVGIGFAWEVIDNIPATRFNYYSCTAPTLNDRTSEYSGNTYFRITALTNDEDIFYSSNILSGNSVDNLAPLPVNGLAAIPTEAGVKVSWELNTESDFKEYEIYRSLTEDIDLDTMQVYGTTTDSIFVDETPLNESVYYFVRGTDIHNNASESASVYLNVTGVNDEIGLPNEFSLNQNYPNPFNPSTTISFALPKRADVKLTVYNSIGEKVAELINQNMSAGYHNINFDASSLSSGLYLYRISAGNFVDVKKMLLLK